MHTDDHREAKRISALVHQRRSHRENMKAPLGSISYPRLPGTTTKNPLKIKKNKQSNILFNLQADCKASCESGLPVIVSVSFFFPQTISSSTKSAVKRDTGTPQVYSHAHKSSLPQWLQTCQFCYFYPRDGACVAFLPSSPIRPLLCRKEPGCQLLTARDNEGVSHLHWCPSPEKPSFLIITRS